MSNVLFVCLQNAGRSQMSRALFDASDRTARHQAKSAGTTPAPQVHPDVIVAMDEIGIDLRDRRPQELTRELAEWADVVVTMGCGDACPYIPGKRYIEWQLDDPAGLALEEVRVVRDQIESQVNDLLVELNRTDNR